MNTRRTLITHTRRTLTTDANSSLQELSAYKSTRETLAIGLPQSPAVGVLFRALKFAAELHRCNVVALTNQHSTNEKLPSPDSGKLAALGEQDLAAVGGRSSCMFASVS
jgi:hypothetical protein